MQVKWTQIEINFIIQTEISNQKKFPLKKVCDESPLAFCFYLKDIVAFLVVLSKVFALQAHLCYDVFESEYLPFVL